MAILINDVTPYARYVATAGQTLFTVPFEFFNEGDLIVLVNDVTLTYSPTPADETQYSVTGANQEGGGSITLGAPGATLNDDVVIYRAIPIARSANYPETGPMAIASLNTEQAKHIGIMQQLQREADRSVLLPLGETGFELPVAADRANKVLAFDANGDLLAADAATHLAPLGAFGVTLVENATSAGARSDLAVNSAAELAAVNGAGLIGFGSVSAYPAGTVGLVLTASEYAQSETERVVWDNFDDADGGINGRALPVGGASWAVTGNSTSAQIIDGAMYGDEDAVNSNFYAQIDYDAQIKSISGICRFEQRDIAASAVTSRGPQVVLIADATGSLENMLHFQINQNRWIIDARLGGVWTFGINGSSYWMEPGVDYLCQLQIDRNTNSYRCRISGPEGKLVDTDWVVYAPLASFPTMQRAVWQIQQMSKTTDAFKPSWRAVAIGPYKRNGSAVNFGDGPNKEKWHSGQSVLRFDPIDATVNTYWSILEATTLSVFAISGTLYIQAVADGGSFINVAYRVLNTNNMASPIIEPVGRELAFGSIPLSIRASNDSDEARIDVAFTNAASDNVTANIVFVGDGNPANYNKPRSGVSALTSNSSIYVVSPSTVPDRTSATISANGYHSVISQSTFAAGGGIQGFFDVEVTRVDTAVGSRIFMYVDQYGAVSLKPITLFPMYPSGQTVNKVRISRFGGNVRVDVNLPDAASFPVNVRVRRLAGEGVPVIAAAAAALATENLEQTLQIATPTADYWNGQSGFRVGNTKVIGSQGAAVADATGGATVDTEARTAINTLLARLRAHGLIAT